MYKVLVVEDEELIRKGIVLTVDWPSIDCMVVGEAANGEEGLEAAERLKQNGKNRRNRRLSRNPGNGLNVIKPL